MSTDDAGGDSDAGLDAYGIEPATGLPTEARLFFLFGFFSLFLGTVYLVWTTNSPGGTEWAGGIGLLFASGFALFFATFLTRSLRTVQLDVETFEANEDAGITDPDQILFLPDTSIWPIGIGVGASLTVAGFALGYWVAIPGLVLFLHSVIGFAHQSRDRR